MFEILAHSEIVDTVNNSERIGHMMDGHYLYGGGTYDYFWMVLLMVISTLIVASIIFYFLRHNDKGSMTPLDSAKDRYAKGEISKKEFEQIKKDIS
jgi:uncharacterized membrane protein